MSWLQPAWPLGFVNFTAALRKPLLQASGYFSPNQETAWIWSIPNPTINGSPVQLLGTLDGINAVFTTASPIVDGVSVFRNGALQNPGVMYQVNGNTITFLFPYIPQPGDYLLSFLGNLAGSALISSQTHVVPVGSSPFIYSAGQGPETIYMSGGVVSLITKNGIAITQSLPVSIVLQPGETIIVTYSVAPYMVSSSGIVSSPGAASPDQTVLVPVGSSPFVYAAGQNPQVLWISGGDVQLITKNGIAITESLPVSIILQPGETITINYTSAPYMVASS